jgi:hypothetical protein
MAKAKAAAAPVVPLLTGPVAVKGGKGSIKAELRGHEASIDRLVEIRHTQDSLKAEEALLREPVEEAANQERAKLEANTGKTIKSVIVHGTNQPARVTWRNVYSAIDVVHETPLRAALGPHFDSLFERIEAVKPRKLSADKVDDLRTLLGPRFDSFFEVIPQIVAKDELLEKRTVLVESGSVTEAQNQAIDSVLSQVQASPSLSVK